MFIEALTDRVFALLPMSAQLQKFRNRLATFGDQGAQGVANIAISALSARLLSREDFASIGMMLGAHYFMLGFHRAFVVLPYILDQSATAEPLPGWWKVNTAGSLAIGAVLGLAALAVFVAGGPDLHWVATGLACAAVVSPLLCTADFAKRWLYQSGRAVTAAVSSVVYAVVGIAWVLSLSGTHSHSVWLAAAAWAAASAASLALSWSGGSVMRSTWSVAVEHARSFRHFSLWQSATHLPYTLYNNSAVLVIGAFAGPLAASAFTATRTLTTPANSMVSAVDSLDKPRAARALAEGGHIALRDSIRRTRRLLILLTGSYLLVVAIAAPWFITALMGAQYADTATAVRILCASFFLMGLNQPSETLLIVLRESKVLLATRSVGALSAVVGLWLGTRLGGLEGACWSLLATQTINFALLRISEVFVLRHAHPTSDPAAPL